MQISPQSMAYFMDSGNNLWNRQCNIRKWQSRPLLKRFDFKDAVYKLVIDSQDTRVKGYCMEKPQIG